MADHSSIEWTEATWNPIAGCSIVSPGCANCYAMRRVAPRLAANPATPHYHGTVEPSKAGPVWTGRIGIASDRVLTAPLRWKRPRMIFVNSTSDLFHPRVPDAVIDRIFAVMALCPQHTFQVLTKRPERMREYLLERWQPAKAQSVQLGEFNVDFPAEQVGEDRRDQIEREINDLFGNDRALNKRFADTDNEALWDAAGDLKATQFAWPLPNVWLGTSVEDQRRADERIPQLLQTPAAIRFISAEPLLGPIDLTNIKPASSYHGDAHGWSALWRGNAIGRPWLDWVIVGGESGHGARPMHPDWARALRDQCAAAGVPFFFKQWGEWIGVEDLRNLPGGRGPGFGSFDHCQHHVEADAVRIGKHAAGRLLDGITHDAMPAHG